MGRPKKNPDESRSHQFLMRSRPAFMNVVRDVVRKAGDKNMGEMIERLIRAEAMRVGIKELPAR